MTEGAAYLASLVTPNSSTDPNLNPDRQVVDCSMTEGAAYLASFVYRMRAEGLWADPVASPGEGWLDGGAPFYRTYRCRCGPASLLKSPRLRPNGCL